MLGPLLAALAGRAPIVLADCYQSGQHYVETGADAVLASYPEVAAYVKYEAEVTVPAVIAAALAGAPRATHAGARPDLDALPAPAWGQIDLAARDRFCADVVARLGRGRWAFPIDGRTLPEIGRASCRERV